MCRAFCWPSVASPPSRASTAASTSCWACALISPPDRVTIWKSQLTTNAFPPVCAMCGAPAETWRKFRFSTAPPWAYLLGAIVVAAISRRASGYLPMTHACVKRLKLVTWGLFSLIPLAFVLWIAAAFVSPSGNDSTRSAITVLLVILGVAALAIGLVGLATARRLYGPPEQGE